MTEPMLFGIPLSLMFLYFVWYSFLGWCMETVYCSVLARHFVKRGFLHGPVCPIYGVGVLIMVNFFGPFTGNPILFYLVAMVSMSAWEYFVGWLLETTTHVKYWDYSNHRFNLKGRICLVICLWWGVAAYLCIFWLHPLSVSLFRHLSTGFRLWLSGALAGVLAADAFFTIRQLVLASSALAQAERIRQALDSKRLSLQRRADELRLNLELAKLEARHSDLMVRAAHYSQRFLRNYSRLSSPRYADAVSTLKRRGQELARQWKSSAAARREDLRSRRKH